jgi:hypothetical protein
MALIIEGMTKAELDRLHAPVYEILTRKTFFRKGNHVSPRIRIDGWESITGYVHSNIRATFTIEVSNNGIDYIPVKTLKIDKTQKWDLYVFDNAERIKFLRLTVKGRKKPRIEYGFYGCYN